ncbi:amino acid kinase family protein [Candidatus Vampirococcus lugosii]|uniref:Glutamate 5-kinase n=1 Tax=Candidatus Vampirococcus lugosii TaxID=2789015 RepID=A0ABS5QMK3_9BACT|nr:hypothetical protein [Candidatus Vampirococcus lugosii]MBS8122446.1 Glutamate 5-kinase [Candidatus Vampirococcus lugosii]
MNKNLCVLKFGSDSIVSNSMTYEESISYFRKQIGDAISDFDEKMDFVIISSGAVKMGKSILGENISSQLSASVGQMKLMDFWKQVLGPMIGQVLVSYNSNIDFSNIGYTRFQKLIEDFHDKFIKQKQDQNTFNLLNDLLKNNITPIINFNDAVDKLELEALAVLQDNDRLFAYIVELLSILGDYEKIYGIIYTNTAFCISIDGYFCPIPQINIENISLENLLQNCDGSSSSGTGGMESKVQVAYGLCQDNALDSCLISDIKEGLKENLEFLQGDGRQTNSTKFTR